MHLRKAYGDTSEPKSQPLSPLLSKVRSCECVSTHDWLGDNLRSSFYYKEV